MSFSKNLDRAIDENKLFRTEGRKGVENLCKIVQMIGYVDKQYFGQFEGGSFGDLIEFLEDNSGAVQAIIEWIKEEGDDNYEWQEMLGNDYTCQECGEELSKNCKGDYVCAVCEEPCES